MHKRFQLRYSKSKALCFELGLSRTLIASPQKEIHSGDVNKRQYNKVFCIGFGKTGTTSIERALTQFGFTLGNQAVGEILAEEWLKSGRVDRIIKFCHTADAFQDLPFGSEGLYEELDRAFPNSKFILTIRDDADQWFHSLVNFHTKLFSADKSRPPTEEDLDNALYRYKGFILDSRKNAWGYPEVPLYDKAFYTQRYLNHIQSVKEYFKNRPDDLLVLNVAEAQSYQKLAHFCGLEVSADASFPWLNKT